MAGREADAGARQEWGPLATLAPIPAGILVIHSWAGCLISLDAHHCFMFDSLTLPLIYGLFFIY